MHAELQETSRIFTGKIIARRKASRIINSMSTAFFDQRTWFLHDAHATVGVSVEPQAEASLPLYTEQASVWFFAPPERLADCFALCCELPRGGREFEWHVISPDELRDEEGRKEFESLGDRRGATVFFFDSPLWPQKVVNAVCDLTNANSVFFVTRESADDEERRELIADKLGLAVSTNESSDGGWTLPEHDDVAMALFRGLRPWRRQRFDVTAETVEAGWRPLLIAGDAKASELAWRSEAKGVRRIVTLLGGDEDFAQVGFVRWIAKSFLWLRDR